MNRRGGALFWGALGILMLSSLVPSALRAKVKPGLTVKDGKLYKDGKIYRGIGMNYCDLFQALLGNPDDDRTLKGLAFLGEKRIPFVRFWCCGFWPSDWDLYFEDKEEWFRRLDMVVRTAEENNVGLIPSMFWRTSTYPDLVDEYQDQWGNPDSKTHEFMRTYTREVVTRYKDSPSIWGWEFANEMNLNCDLPNGMEFLGKVIPHLKVNLEKDEKNLITNEIAQIAYKAFAHEVRKYDDHRFITTGNSSPRPCAYHIAGKLEPIWGYDDQEQAFQAFRWFAPDPMDLVSVHSYGGKPEEMKYGGVQGIEQTLSLLAKFSKRINRPLFVGEFAGLGPDHTELKDEFPEYQKAYLDTILQEKIDLAAYWVFDYTADREIMGLVRKDNEWAWVIDQIVEYNDKISKQIASE